MLFWGLGSILYILGLLLRLHLYWGLHWTVIGWRWSSDLCSINLACKWKEAISRKYRRMSWITVGLSSTCRASLKPRRRIWRNDVCSEPACLHLLCLCRRWTHYTVGVTWIVGRAWTLRLWNNRIHDIRLSLFFTLWLYLHFVWLGIWWRTWKLLTCWLLSWL